MQSCKPVHLTVSLAHDGDIPVARDPATAKKKESGEACEPETSKTQALVKPVRPINPQNVVDVESTGNIKEVPWVLDICLVRTTLGCRSTWTFERVDVSVTLPMYRR